MGLDMYLSADAYFSGSEYASADSKAAFAALSHALDGLPGLTRPFQHEEAKPSVQIEVPVMYWRKANHIHKWFVDNVQKGQDDCRRAHVDIDQLRELEKVCGLVYMAQGANAAEFLPPQDGFFFGDTDVDEYYLEQTRLTMECLHKLIEQYDAGQLAHWEFYYRSSW
jgi:hypothetical protein